MVCAPVTRAANDSNAVWTFAVSGDSRNCGDFVMPVIASRVKAERDAFYWHLGDFRWMSKPDEDLTAMEGGTLLSVDEYRQVAWDDFLTHQLAAFGDFPVFLGRGNHETVAPMTRDRYIAKFSGYLNRPEIVAQDRLDGGAAAPLSSPWYHVVRDGIDFITMDNAAHEEFSDAQLAWLRGVLDRDLAAGSGVKTIIAGMHEALPNSTSSNHAMDDSGGHGTESGEKAYRWFAAAQAAGKHVYLLASHSHFYSPDIYNSPEWRKAGIVVPGVIIGSAGAHRYLLPKTVDPRSKTHIYGYLQATVHGDGTIDFALKEISEKEMVEHKWPNAPAATVHECFVGNSD